MGTPRPKTPEEKVSLVRAWLEERYRLGTTQVDFAQRHGIGERTLRQYVTECDPQLPPAHQLREILGRALTDMQRLYERLSTLDAGPAAEPANTGDRRSVTGNGPAERLCKPSGPAAASLPPAADEKEISTTKASPSNHQFWED